MLPIFEILFGCGVSCYMWQGSINSSNTSKKNAAERASTITAGMILLTLDALLNIVSWARLRRRPPPAGAAFGRKFADNRCCLLPQQRQNTYSPTAAPTHTHVHIHYTYFHTHLYHHANANQYPKATAMLLLLLLLLGPLGTILRPVGAIL